MKVKKEALRKSNAFFLSHLQFSLFMSEKSNLLVSLVQLDFTVEGTLFTLRAINFALKENV